MNGASATTHPAAADPRLRGRTYAITFDRVWTAALSLAGGGLPRWRIVSADDEQGMIVAEAASPVLRRPNRVRVRVSLDANAQTRVDLVSTARGSRDWGGNARRIAHFVRALDGKLAAKPNDILDATRQPQFST